MWIHCRDFSEIEAGRGWKLLVPCCLDVLDCLGPQTTRAASSSATLASASASSPLAVAMVIDCSWSALESCPTAAHKQLVSRCQICHNMSSPHHQYHHVIIPSLNPCTKCQLVALRFLGLSVVLNLSLVMPFTCWMSLVALTSVARTTLKINLSPVHCGQRI